MRRVILGLTLSLALGGCGLFQQQQPAEPELAPLTKITAVEIRVPTKHELPPVIGHMQRYRIAPKDTLLDVGRNAGLGFNEVKDANREYDEWIPPVGQEVEVPTQWILPRSSGRGLVINVPEMRLYMFPQNAKPGELVLLRTWAVAIGENHTPTPGGAFTISSKDKNPTWYVPDSIPHSERPKRVVPPGPDNPMGEYRIRLSRGLYSIHGTDTPWAIGRQTTHGCIRLYPEDIDDLYELVQPKMRGQFVYEPIKFGEQNGRIYVEVHSDPYRRYRSLEKEAFRLAKAQRISDRIDADLLRFAVIARRGVPVDITRPPNVTRALDTASAD
ncbi:MAG: L,D-transpeptidase family protein [Candidatus Binatia bacterium]